MSTVGNCFAYLPRLIPQGNRFGFSLRAHSQDDQSICKEIFIQFESAQATVIECAVIPVEDISSYSFHEGFDGYRCSFGVVKSAAFCNECPIHRQWVFIDLTWWPFARIFDGDSSGWYEFYRNSGFYFISNSVQLEIITLGTSASNEFLIDLNDNHNAQRSIMIIMKQ